VEQTQMGGNSPELTEARRNSRRYARLSWTTWIVDGMLLLAAVVGAWFAWPIQSEAGRLHAKRLDLQRVVGEMPISDPKKFHVLLLKNENPLEFRWRLYIPEKTFAMLLAECRSSTGSGSGTSSISGSADPGFECLITATILPTEGSSDVEIKTRIRTAHSRGTGAMNLHDQVIQRMVNAKDTSSWRIAGKNGVEAFSIEEMVGLLAIEPTSPDDVSKKPGTIRIGVGTQAVIAKVQSQ
jgi:hypothetical protein